MDHVIELATEEMAEVAGGWGQIEPGVDPTPIGP